LPNKRIEILRGVTQGITQISQGDTRMTKQLAAPPAKLGTPVKAGPRTWVQTERAAHEQWARLVMSSPRAAALMHHFVALMGHQNAVVIPQKTLARLPQLAGILGKNGEFSATKLLISWKRVSRNRL
jgi:hypothetical protein